MASKLPADSGLAEAGGAVALPCAKESAAVVPNGRVYSLSTLQLMSTVGTGTFGRVVLCRDKTTKEYLALKVMNISDVVRLKQIEHVRNEKAILMSIKHPFIVNMLWAHRDDAFLYMLLEYVPGGELFTYLRTAQRFNTATGRFYSAEIVSAFEFLHVRNIVYRDLKPENILLDKDGHAKLTDFGFAKELHDRTWTLCGTPEYLAPEIIQNKGHSLGVDWWALGILIYEMLVGFPPFYDDNPFGIYEKILMGKIDWPRFLEPIAKDLIKKLLVYDRTKRLGNMKNGVEDVKRHKFFREIDSWEAVLERKLRPPIIPRVEHPGDTRNFDSYQEDEWWKAPPAPTRQIEHFKDF